MAQQTVSPGIADNYVCGKLEKRDSVLVITIKYKGKDIELKSDPLIENKIKNKPPS